MKTTLITTVFNEEKTIIQFLNSVVKQIRLPDETVIIDGGSNDKTMDLVKDFSRKNPKLNIKLFVKKGNRSIGRNEAIRRSANEIIAITDAGNILDKNWLSKIIMPFEDSSIDVVAGYYKGIAGSIFQKCLIPYVLVMPDKVNENEFLPATRSMAIRKSVWKKAGEFNEKLSHNEDYAFANKLRDIGAKIVFEQSAIVNWIPRSSIKSAFVMFFRFAMGDAEAGLLRDRVILLFLRYCIFLCSIMLSTIIKSYIYSGIVLSLLTSYILWSVVKNYKYVSNLSSFYFLPLIQITSDIAVIIGTIIGLIKKITFLNIYALISKNKLLCVIIGSYIALMLITINYGIPNFNHPFNYFMDEWHQSQSVRNLFKFGTPNMAGSANGSILQFFLTGIYLIPFQIFHIVNVLAIKSSVTNLNFQTTLFWVLRINTMIFGVGSIILMYYIAKRYFRVNPVLVAVFFTFNPVFMMLSNYYKYDIALMFWIILALLSFLNYIKNQNTYSYVLAGIFSSLAMCTKLMVPLPLLIAYIILFFFFTKEWRKKIKYLFLGLFTYLAIFVLIGNPDVIFGKGNINEYLFSTMIQTPFVNTQNYVLGNNGYPYYLLVKLYPVIYGHVFYILSLISIFFLSLLYFIKRKFINNIHLRSVELLSILFIIFTLSLIPLKVGATNNRMLVLLPFMSIYIGLFLHLTGKLKLLFKKSFVLLICILVIVQILEVYSWFPIKLINNPQIKSSEWVIKNIPSRTTIGIENIPIYQSLPDVVLKEFYLKEYKMKFDSIYNYEVISSKSKPLPNFIILSNVELEKKYFRVSDKNKLVRRLEIENYREIKKFIPDLKYYLNFGTELDYFMSGLIQAPNSISVYERIK